MREKIIRFMQGRYGADQFGRFLSGLSMVLLVISVFSRHQIWFTLALLVLIYEYFRMFSEISPNDMERIRSICRKPQYFAGN